MKQELSNQFTEGLVCDLNPIITPNTVLTDNLNGTIITYDGNEYSLQNDKGNYALQHCKLRPNYIPVGVKEYSDILYIVSYNPLDNHVEIGSYPSPLTIEASNIDDEHHEINSLIQQIGENKEVPLVDNEPNTANFSDLIKQSEMKLFYGDSEEEYKMYPGDSYIVEVEGEHEYKYEELEYYIVDENRQKYNVSDLVEDENVEQIGKLKYESDDYINVAWQVPGWLGMQYRLATFEDFSMNIRQFVVPNIGTKNLSATDVKLNFQFKISDKLFLKDQEVTKGDLKIKLNAEINKEGVAQKTIEKIISLEESTFIEWYEESKILWIDYADEDFKNFFTGMDCTDVIKLTAIPFFTVKEKSLYYDPFKEIIEIPLNSIGDWSDFKLGSSIWKFWAELEKWEETPSNCYLEFDVTGPLVTTSIINLYYRVLDVDENIILDYRSVPNYGGVSDLNYISIPFEGDFKSEGIYIIDLCFANTIESCSGEDSCHIVNLLIASQLFQDFVGLTDDFRTITFDQWTSKYYDRRIDKKSMLWNIDASATYNGGPKRDIGKYENGKLSTAQGTYFEKMWTYSELSSDNYLSNVFIPDDIYDKHKDFTMTFARGYACDGIVNLESEVKPLTGPLWDSLNQQIIFKFTSGEKSSSISKNLNQTDTYKNITGSVECIGGAQLLFTNEEYYSGTFYDNSAVSTITNIPMVFLRGFLYHAGGINVGTVISVAETDGLKFQYGQSLNFKEIFRNNDTKTFSPVDSNIGPTLVSILDRNKAQFGVILLCVADPDKRAYGISVIKDGVSYARANDGSYFVTDRPFVFFRSSMNTVTLVELADANYSAGGSIIEAGLTETSATFFKSWNIEQDLSSYKSWVICSKDNIFSDGKYIVPSVIQSDQNETTIKCEILISGVTNWNYNGKNLFNQITRNNISKKCKCGDLLNGKTNSFDELSVYNNIIENIAIDNIPELSSKDLTDINNVLGLYQEIITKTETSLSELNSDPVYNALLEAGPNTRGLYNKNREETDLLVKLNSTYKNSSNEYLILNNTTSMFKFSRTNSDGKDRGSDNTIVQIASGQTIKWQ